MISLFVFLLASVLVTTKIVSDTTSPTAKSHQDVTLGEPSKDKQPVAPTPKPLHKASKQKGVKGKR